VSSLDKARAPKCKEIAHVICTKPPLLKKKRWKKKFVLFSKTVEKRKKKKKKKERRDKKQREIIEIPLFPLLLFCSLSCLVSVSLSGV
jgi:hypothetical protein